MDTTDTRDETATGGDAEDGEISPVSPAPERVRMPKWPFFLAGLFLLIGAAVAVTWPINVPYYALSPGPVNDTSDYVAVEEPAGEEGGDLFFLTVSLREINAIEYVGALINDEVDLSPRENIRPAGVSQDDLRQQNLDLMNTSQTNAKFVALSRLGYEVTYEGTGALVESIIEDSAAEGVLLEGDVIVDADGEPVEFLDDAVELIGGRAPGDVVPLTIERTNEDGEVETLVFDITLKSFRAVDTDGNIIDDPDRGMVGVLLANAPTVTVFPIEIDIDAQNIGGPSAGLMFALEVMNQLTEEDLTHGYRIAGTGSIDSEGDVGNIGGIRQKVFGAIDVGADYVLVPAGNYDDAFDAAGDKIVVVRVATIDDALAFFETLTPAA